jgi:hypothetical protein
MSEKKKNTNSANIGFKSIKNKFNAFTITEIILTRVKKERKKKPLFNMGFKIAKNLFYTFYIIEILLMCLKKKPC